MSDRDVPATSWAVWAWQAYRDGRLVEADRIEELEAKLAQQDDLVQAAVAAALREAAKISDQWIGCEPITSGILALITPDAQAALDRVVAAERTMRPIGTAPKDGTHILVAPYGDLTDLQVSWFIEGEDRWANWSWSVEPSHWFPLPAIRKGGE
jgi:hypothetical protein